MKHILSIIGLSLLGFALVFGQGGVGGKGGFGGKGGVGGGMTAGGKTWTLIQHPKNFTCSGTAGVGNITCTVTASSSTSGNLLILLSGLFVPAQSGNPSFSSASGDSVWTHCPSQGAFENYSGSNWEASDCAYILSATGGATSFSFVWQLNSTGGSYSADTELLEFHPSSGGATYETCGAGGATACVTTSASCSTCTGPTPTVTGTDVVVIANANENDCTAVASPFNVSPSPDVDNVNVFGLFGWSLSQTSGNAASYTCTAGGAAMLAAAWK